MTDAPDRIWADANKITTGEWGLGGTWFDVPDDCDPVLQVEYIRDAPAALQAAGYVRADSVVGLDRNTLRELLEGDSYEFNEFGRMKGINDTANAILAAINGGVVSVKGLGWEWIGDRHAFGKISGFSYEILRVEPHEDHPISNPPDISKKWRGKNLGRGKGGKYLGYEWFCCADDAMVARQSQHNARILSALTTHPAAEAEQAGYERGLKEAAEVADEYLTINVLLIAPRIKALMAKGAGE